MLSTRYIQKCKISKLLWNLLLIEVLFYGTICSTLNRSEYLPNEACELLNEQMERESKLLTGLIKYLKNELVKIS